jgi:hypothetical protein
MRQKGLSIFILWAFALLLAPAILADYQVVNGPAHFYFGHISYSEVKNDGKDAEVLREGKLAPELAVVNLPLGPGDTIRTSDVRRCELQFDNGTIIRLDYDSELKIETILAQSLSSLKRMTNFVLSKGAVYVMYKEYDSKEMFQILTSNAAVWMNQHTVATLRVGDDGSTDIQVLEGKAQALFGPDTKKIKQEKIRKGEKLTVAADHRFALGRYAGPSEFEVWNDGMNENFMVLHEGKSNLPKPIQKWDSPFMYYFAHRFSLEYGEWFWDDLYGYVWRPYYNDVCPWGDWMPMVFGHWSSLGGQLFWVPAERWGWVPYHLGLWVWSKKKGWLWIPGRAFSPSWANWEYMSGYYAWRPWTLWDWYWYYGSNPFFYLWGYDPLLAYNFYSNYYYYPGFSGSVPPKDVLTKISKDQLKKPDASPRYPLPKELKSILKASITALKKGDEDLIASVQKLPSQYRLVKASDLTAPRIEDKAIRLEELSQSRSFSDKERVPMFVDDPHLSAVRIFNQHERIDAFREFVLPSPARSVPRQHFEPQDMSFPPSRQERAVKERSTGSDASPYFRAFSDSLKPQSAMRFRDWNPDVRTAMRIGVEIRYSSLTNEVRCPQLGISSRTFSSSSGGVPSSSGGPHVFSSSSGSSGGGPVATSSSSSGGSSSHPSSSSSSSSGHTKKD